MAYHLTSAIIFIKAPPVFENLVSEKFADLHLLAKQKWTNVKNTFVVAVE